MNLISLMIKYRVNCTRLHSSTVSLPYQLCFHPSWIPVISLLPFIHHIFSHATQLFSFLLSFAVQPPSSLPLPISHLVYLLYSSNSHRLISEFSSCYNHTFLHIITRYFTDWSEKAFTGTNFALGN